MATFAPIAIYSLAILGLGAFALLPIRCWQLIRVVAASRSSLRVTLIVIAGSLAVGGLAIEADVLARLLPCLAGDYCGPSQASALVYLAILGAVYLAMEVAGQAVRLVARRSQPNNSFKGMPLRGTP